MPLTFEVSANGSGWRHAATVKPGDREGSVSDNRDGRRDVIMFRCDGDRSVVRLSAAGTDFEAGAERVILPLAGFEELASLGPGESYERDVTTDRGLSCRLRWTHAG